MGMIFAASTGPLGSIVHFWEFSADQDGCIRARHTILVPRTPSTGDLSRQANPVKTKRHASRRTGPQMTSISAMPPDCSGTGRARGAEYSVFLHGTGGGTSGSGRTSQPFYAICNGKYAKHQEIALLVSKLSAGQQHLRPAPKSNRAGTLMADPHQNANAARALSQKGCPSRA